MLKHQPQWGRKAQQLESLRENGIRVPGFFVFTRTQAGSAGDEQALQRLLSETFRKQPDFFAVRSSARNEDTETTSMAGAFRTELGVPAMELIAAAKNVLGSYPSADDGDCVIIQEFIPSDCAGVLFTNAGDHTCVVNATCGLCDAVVKGLPVDEYVLDAQGGILSSAIAQQKVCRFFAGGRLEERTVNDERGALNESQLRTLFTTGKRIENLLGCPQDIEWCFFSGELFILQSRPITRIIRPEETFYDSANIAESYSGIVLPLTFSFAEDIYKHVYQNLLIASGVSSAIVRSHAGIFDRMLAHCFGRMYYNMNNWYRMMAFLPGYDRNKQNLERMISSNMREEIARTIRPTAWLRLKYPVLVVWKLLWFGKTVRSFERDVRTRLTAAEDRLRGGMKADEAEALYRNLHQMLVSRWHVTVENDFLVMTFLGLLKKKLRSDEAMIAHVHFQNVSAAQVLSLAALGRAVFANARHDALFKRNEIDALWSSIRSDEKLNAAIETYFGQYGGRFANELKLESPDLQEDHTLFLRLLHRYAYTVFPPQRGEQSRLSASQPLALRWLLKSFRKAAQKREELRLLRSRAFGIVRKLFRAAGEDLRQAGKLLDREDVFYLTVDEVFALARGKAKPEEAQERIRERRREYAAYAAMKVHSHFSCRGEPAEQDVLESAPSPAPGALLKGTGSTPGTVTGKVSLFPAFRIPETEIDIVVAERTDPGWTPLIGLSKGMILEHGGILSHAAIVARELGIPTVIGVQGALSRLRDGQTVTIDGTKGSVRIHE